MAAETRKLCREVVAHVLIGVLDLGDDFLASVDEGDDVGEIPAAEEVLASTTPERRELGGEEV